MYVDWLRPKDESGPRDVTVTESDDEEARKQKIAATIAAFTGKVSASNKRHLRQTA